MCQGCRLLSLMYLARALMGGALKVLPDRMLQGVFMDKASKKLIRPGDYYPAVLGRLAGVGDWQKCSWIQYIHQSVQLYMIIIFFFKINVSSSSEHLDLFPKTHRSYTFWYFSANTFGVISPANWSQMEVTNHARNLPCSPEHMLPCLSGTRAPSQHSTQQS